jgi:hypothetical protein
MTLLKSLLLTVAAATFATTPVLAGDDYTIVLDRPDKVGEKAEFAYSGDFQALQQLLANGKVAKLIKNDNYHAELKTVETTLKIDEKNNAVEISATISKFTKKNNSTGETKELLPAGTVVEAKKKDKNDEYLINGKPVPPEVLETLKHFIRFSHSKHNDDDVFGTKEKKKVGDSWPINKTPVIQDLTDAKMKADPAKIEGKTTLEKIDTVDGVKCVLLKANLDAKDVILPMPPGFNVKESTMKSSFSGMFPVDTAKHGMSSTSSEDLRCVFSKQGNAQAPTIEIEISQKSLVKWTRKTVK